MLVTPSSIDIPQATLDGLRDRLGADPLARRGPGRGLGLRGASRRDAGPRPIPLLVTHGWPSSFGHFLALEEPDLLAEALRVVFREFR
jgi:pimeloyl-ACP methyl ester carboxylesterase